MFETSLRSHICGGLTMEEINKKVVLCGWVYTRRDHGGIIFIDLRDRYGVTQLVFNPNTEYFKEADKLKREDVVQVEGTVKKRPKGMENKNMVTGDIEVFVDKLTVLNKSDVLPFDIEDRIDVNEEIRLKYRYLDLRRPIMQQRLLIRHKAAQAARSYLSSENFLEIETPLFVKTTPGGARVFKVPSRKHPGQFYALPESPQMYKQLLMVAGCDRYFQIARCLRDEDLRADRQPEFTQIDIEMSFIDREDIYKIIEDLLKEIFKNTINLGIKIPFQRLSYYEAMSKYGSDKPDLRFGLELQDVTNILKHSEFNIFKSVIDKKGVVFCLNAKNCAGFSRGEIDKLAEIAKIYKLNGLAWLKVLKDSKLDGSIVKFLPEKVQKDLIKNTDAKENDLLLFAAEHFEKAVIALGEVRLHLGEKLKLINPKDYKFCWVTDFPSFEIDAETESWVAKHHIFTAPLDEDTNHIETNPEKVRSKAYDVVLNGVEIGGGSIRINKKDLQTRMLQVTGLAYEEAEKKFDFLLNAFKFSAPPHGGIAIGFDRLCALLCGINDIREVIAFPKNKSAENPMDSSPQEWTGNMLKELHLKLDIVKK